jgi:hypothetical protein
LPISAVLTKLQVPVMYAIFALNLKAPEWKTVEKSLHSIELAAQHNQNFYLPGSPS